MSIEKLNTKKPDSQKETADIFFDLDSKIFQFSSEHSDINSFFPEYELKTIRNFLKTLSPDLQSSARRVLISDFKKKLKQTRINSAKAQFEMEAFIRNNPGKPDKEIEDELEKIIFLNDLDTQYFDFKKAIEKLLENRKNILRTINAYKSEFGEKWEINLFRNLFGNFPKGKIRIQVLPTSVYIEMLNIEDFIFAAASKGDPESLNYYKKRAKFFNGVFLSRTFEKVPDLDFKIILRNGSKTNFKDSEQTKMHEEEHSIFYNLYDLKLSENLKEPTTEHRVRTFLNLQGEINHDAFINAIDKFLTPEISYWNIFAKSEILSYLKGGTTINNILLFLVNKESSYTYFEITEKETTQKILKMWSMLTKNGVRIKNKNLSTNDILTLIHKRYLKKWDEYKKGIRKALFAVAKISKKYQKSSVDRMKMIRILSQEPLGEWHRLEKIMS